MSRFPTRSQRYALALSQNEREERLAPGATTGTQPEHLRALLTGARDRASSRCSALASSASEAGALRVRRRGALNREQQPPRGGRPRAVDGGSGAGLALLVPRGQLPGRATLDGSAGRCVWQPVVVVFVCCLS